ncbi:hypothetical protein PybrP1_012175 [[Pythium] brassicae (nom. inval.)]|nr:hypothetical protein PybrP1_012175 [[Pythium] brassicae (nom. inval.)]
MEDGDFVPDSEDDEQQQQQPAQPPPLQEDDDDIERGAEDPTEQPEIRVGDLVEVESRTWPGINKPGGSGRVAAVHRGSEVGRLYYDVRYVLGGFEKRVEAEFVELSRLLQFDRAPPSRVRYERVFYHDEVAQGADGARVAAKASSTTKTKTRRRSNESNRKSPRGGRQPQEPLSVVDFDGSSGDDRDSDKSDEKVVDSIQLVREPRAPARVRREGDLDDHEIVVIAADKWRRPSRIIESESESESESSGLETPPLVRDALPRKRRSHSHSHSHTERARVRPSKKRRYVGGYFHSGDDADATFIQPEDNANALPDDVARGIGFRLGKSKAELKAQLAAIADALTAHLRTFRDEKDLVTQKSKRASSLPVDELLAFYRQTAKLADFLTQNLIRGGEDVMNAVIVKLTRKGGSLPDSVELVFDDQKREISDHGVWVRKVLAALEASLKLRGVSLPSLEPTRDDGRRNPSESDDDKHGEARA